MLFMPEMLQFCGQRLRVGAVAIDMRNSTPDLEGAPPPSDGHLAGLRCDGSAHGGCQAECNLFWKDVWLKPATTRGVTQRDAADAPRALGGCTEASFSPIHDCLRHRRGRATLFLPNDKAL